MISTTAACSMQSLLFRHVLNQILSLSLFSFGVSISGEKPPANLHFLNNNHNSALTRQTRLQHSPETTQQGENLCSIFSLPVSTSSSFRETYLHGKSTSHPSAWGGSSCDPGKPLRGILAPASPQEGSHAEAWSLLGQHHPVTCAQIPTFVAINSLVLTSGYVVLVLIMQDWFARNISQRGS